MKKLVGIWIGVSASVIGFGQPIIGNTSVLTYQIYAGDSFSEGNFYSKQAPPDYNWTTTENNVHVDDGFVNLSIGSIDVAMAASPASGDVFSEATYNNFSFSILDSFSVTADYMDGLAIASGIPGNFNGDELTGLKNLNITVFGNTVHYDSAGINQVLWSGNGISVIANEINDVFGSPNEANSSFSELSIYFDNVDMGNGQIADGRTSFGNVGSHIQAVPETSSIAPFLGGVVFLMGFAKKRSRRLRSS